MRSLFTIAELLVHRTAKHSSQVKFIIALYISIVVLISLKLVAAAMVDTNGEKTVLTSRSKNYKTYAPLPLFSNDNCTCETNYIRSVKVMFANIYEL